MRRSASPRMTRDDDEQERDRSMGFTGPIVAQAAEAAVGGDPSAGGPPQGAVSRR